MAPVIDINEVRVRALSAAIRAWRQRLRREVTKSAPFGLGVPDEEQRAKVAFTLGRISGMLGRVLLVGDASGDWLGRFRAMTRWLAMLARECERRAGSRRDTPSGIERLAYRRCARELGVAVRDAGRAPQRLCERARRQS